MRKFIDEGLCKELYDNGLNDAQIAQQLGCHYKTVTGWRKRNKLAGHRNAKHKAVTEQEQRVCDDKLRPPSELYIACIDLDFSWYDWEIQQVASDYRKGLTMQEMARNVGRKEQEVMILLVDLSMHRFLVPKGVN